MIAPLMMMVSVLLLLFGMFAGLGMGMAQDFTLAPAHAHLNLVGGVLLFLYGLYYRVIPAAGAMGLAKVQGYTHIAGAILFPIGIAIIRIKQDAAYEIFPIMGSLIVVAAMIMFTIIVFRTAKT